MQDQENSIDITIDKLDPKETLLLPISVDQKYHNHETFLAILNYLNVNNIKVEIVVADTLKRFTFQMAGAFNEKACLKASKKIGKDWVIKNLEGNKSLYENLIINKKLKVTHWDEFKEQNKDKFNEFSMLVEILYQNKNSGFNKTVDASKVVFLNGFFERNSSNPCFDKAQASLLCLKYILEECTMALLWSSLGYKQQAYPLNRNPMGEKMANCMRVMFNEIKKECEYRNIIDFNLFPIQQLNLKINEALNNKKSVKNINPSQQLLKVCGQHSLFKSQNNHEKSDYDEQVSIMKKNIADAFLQTVSQNPAIAGKLLTIVLKTLIDAVETVEQNYLIISAPHHSYAANASFNETSEEEKLREFKL